MSAIKNIIHLSLFFFAVCVFALELDFTDSGKKLDAAYAYRTRDAETQLLPEGLTIPLSDKDKAAGLVFLKKHPEFNPTSAFEFEAEFRLDANADKRKGGTYYILDNKYDFNSGGGFMVYLDRSQKSYKAVARFGLGGKKQSVISTDYISLNDGKFHTLKIRFDPSGQHEMHLDGALKKKTSTTPGKVAAAEHATVIGCRVGSLFHPFAGVIRRIRIAPVAALEVNPVDMIARKYGSRRVFVRREKDSSTAVKFRNTTDQALSGEVQYSISGLDSVRKGEFSVESGEEGSFAFPVESNLMPGKYTVELLFLDKEGKNLGKGSMQYSIVPEFTDGIEMKADDFISGSKLAQVKELGITSVNWIISPRKGTMSQGNKDRLIEQLDEYLEHGLRCNDKVSINERFFDANKFLRVDKNGKPYARKALDVAEETVYNEALKSSGDAARAVGKHPAWYEIYPNNELRDGTKVSFTENNRKRLKKATGLNMPADAEGRQPIGYSSNHRMPWNQIVPVDDPELRFWTWFWKEGDGWDRLNGDTGALAESIIGRKDFSSRFDPATRSLPYLGIGGKVSCVGTWTYSNPDPIKFGQTIDELLALADNRKMVSIGNQGIWYRSEVAPKEVKVQNPPEWLSREYDARYISPAPDMMIEAYWMAITRKIDRTDTHGQGSWLGPIKHNYRYTNPEITKVFPEFTNEVIKPLGPALKHVDEISPEVVILESFTNALYGGGHTWGWGRGWIADLHLAMQWAHIQPGFCYEEQLLRGDYDDGKVKVLVLPTLRVLNDKLLGKIRELQDKGIFLLGDENLNISLMPDFRISSFSNSRMSADARKKALQKLGGELRDMLAPVLTPCMSSDNQDLILRRRASGDAQYLFAVNDKREYGDYVGQWRKVMEKGLPLSAEFTVRLPVVAAYDIVNHRRKEFSGGKGSARFSVDLKPGRGSIIVVLPRPIAKVSLNAPRRLKRGEDFSIEAFAADKRGKGFSAVLPIEIQFSSGGKVLPGTGFYATDRSGKLVYKDTVALNLPRGKAVLTVRCLASGLSASREIMID